MHARAGDLHNVILLVPKALPAEIVDGNTTPALVGLRAEGVNFNSHSGFPKLATLTDPWSVEQTLGQLGLYDTTDVIVSAEHGVSSVWKVSKTSQSVDVPRQVRPRGQLPPGFVATDLTAALQMKDESLSLFDPEEGDKALDWRAGEYPKRGNAIIGADPSDPQLAIEARGGHDLIYLPERLDLPRFFGHLILCVRGVCHGQAKDFESIEAVSA